MTAYEMRISDWSSDVCSSDLLWPVRLSPPRQPRRRQGLTMPIWGVVLARHRLISLVALAVLILLAWSWLLSGAGMGMDLTASLFSAGLAQDPMAAMMMPGDMPRALARVVMTFAMWSVTIVAFILPSAAPTSDARRVVKLSARTCNQ